MRRQLAPARAALVWALLLAMPLSGQADAHDASIALTEHPDAGFVAASEGSTEDDAVRRMRVQEVVDNISVAIATGRPEMFVGSIIGDPPDNGATIYLKGEADDYVRSLVSSADAAVRLVQGQPYNRDELETRKWKVHTAFLEAGYRDVATSFDIERRGHINVAIASRYGLDAHELALLVPEEMRHDVTARVVDGAIHEPQSAFGGMYGVLNGSNWCLFAWSVVSKTFNRTGVISASAAHCSMMTGIRHPGVGVHTATFESDYWGYYGEVGWWSTPNNVNDPPQFYATASAIRNVNTVEHWAATGQGDDICIFSRQYGTRPCAKVANPSIACAEMNHIVQMNKDITDNGDSGGGWSFNYTAIGIHHGLCGGLSAFSHVFYVPYALSGDDVHVLSN